MNQTCVNSCFSSLPPGAPAWRCTCQGSSFISALLSTAVDCAGDSLGQRQVVERCLKDREGILISVPLCWQRIYFIFINQ